MENLIVSTRKKISMENMFANVKISTENAITKVLNAAVKVNVSSCEVDNGSAMIGGEINATVLYLDENERVESVSGTVEFLEKQRVEFLLKDVFAKDYANVENINFSSNEVMVSISHHADVYGVYDYQIPKINASKDSLVLSTSTSQIRHLVEVKADDFVVVEEYQTNFDELSVLTAVADVVVSSVVVSVDKVVLEGKLITEVVAQNQDNLERVMREIEFSQEIAASGVVPTMTADAKVNVKNANVSVEKVGEKCMLAYNIELGAMAYVYDETSYEFADDMFSLSNEIKTTYGYLAVKSFSEEKNFSNTFTSNIDISNIENLDDVVGVFSAGSPTLKQSAEPAEETPATPA